MNNKNMSKEQGDKMSKEEEIKRNIEELWDKIWKYGVFVGNTYYFINLMEIHWAKITYDATTDRYIAEYHFPTEIITFTFNNKFEAVSYNRVVNMSEIVWNDETKEYVRVRKIEERS